MDKKLYLTDEIFLMKLDNWILFVSDVEDFSEPVHRDDLPAISRAFGVREEVLEDFFDN